MVGGGVGGRLEGNDAGEGGMLRASMMLAGRAIERLATGERSALSDRALRCRLLGAVLHCTAGVGIGYISQRKNQGLHSPCRCVPGRCDALRCSKYC